MIYIYIEDHKLDTDLNTEFKMTLSYSNIEDPLSITGDYSKTITVPGTPNNNRIFGEIWNLDRQIVFGDGDVNTEIHFNASKKTDAKVYINSDLYKKGYVKLNSVKKNKGKISYDMTFYSELCSTLHDLNEKNVSDISFPNNLSHIVNRNNVVSLMQGNNYTLSPYFTYIMANNGMYDNFANDKWLKYDSSWIVEDILGDTEFDEVMMHEYRSYMQRPALKVKGLIDKIVEEYNEDASVKIQLDEEFFNDRNPYYANSYLTMPQYETVSETKKSEQNIVRTSFNLSVEDESFHYISLKNSEYVTDSEIDFSLIGEDTTVNIECGIDISAHFNKMIMDAHVSISGGSYQFTPRYRSASNGFWFEMYLVNSVTGEEEQITGYGSPDQWQDVNDFTVYPTYALGTTDCNENATLYFNQQYYYGSDYNETYFPVHFKTSAKNRTGKWKVAIKFVETPHDFYEDGVVTVYNAWGWGGQSNYFDYELTYVPDYFKVEVHELSSSQYPTNVTAKSGATVFTGKPFTLITSSGITSGSRVSKSDIIPSDFNQGKFLMNYCKLFGLIFDTEELEHSDVITIMTRNKYYSDFGILDWTNKLCMDKDHVQNPVNFDSRYYTLGYESGESYYEEQYQKKYDQDYGTAKVNTGYEFNSDEKELNEDQIFQTAIMSKEKTRMMVNGSIVSKTDDKVLPALFNKDANVRQRTDTKYNLLFYNGLKSTDMQLYVSDDITEMYTVDGSDDKPCWYDRQSMSSQQIYNCMTTLTSYPEYSTLYKDSSGNVYTWDIGYPRENYASWGTSQYPSGINIFNRFWSSYLSETYSVNSKTLTAWFLITYDDILNFKYKKFIKVNDTLWHVNKIVDYNPESSGPTKVELVRVTNIKSYTDGQLIPDTVTGKTKYSVSVTSNGCDISYIPSTVTAGSSFSFTVTRRSFEYSYANMKILVNGSDVTSSSLVRQDGFDYYYTVNSVTGPVSITANFTNIFKVDSAGIDTTKIDSSIVSSVTEHQQFDGTITPKEGYGIDNVVVEMSTDSSTGNLQAVSGCYNNGAISIPDVTGMIRISATADTDTETYRIINSLNDVTTSNLSTYIKKGETYYAVLTPKDGYTMSSVSCTMGGTNVNIENNTVSIGYVTGDIIIQATAILPGDERAIGYELVNCKSSNVITKTNVNTTYSTVITPLENFVLDSASYTMGGTTVDCSDGKINIQSVTDTVKISGKAVGTQSYTITKNLTNCTIDNQDSSVRYGDSYTATITPNRGYGFDDVICTMNGENITVNNGYISISFVTGNIVITASCVRTQDPYSVTLVRTGVNPGTMVYEYVDIDSSFDYLVKTESSAYLTDLIVTMGSETVVSLTDLADNYQLHIDKVTGNIVINTNYVTEDGIVTIDYTLDHTTVDNGKAWVKTGRYYTDTAYPYAGYEIVHAYDTSNGVNTNLTDNSDGTYTYGPKNVNNDIGITAQASQSSVTYTITYNLTHCTSSTDTSVITINSPFTAVISPENASYKISGINVTMGSETIVISNSTISIPRVRGNIVITATAIQEDLTISQSLSYITASNTATSIAYGSSYQNTLSLTYPDDTRYNFFSYLKVTMGSTVIAELNSIPDGIYTVNIASVTDNISIVAKAGSSSDIIKFEYNLDHVSATNNTEWVTAGSRYTTTFVPDNYYTINVKTYKINSGSLLSLDSNGDGTYTFDRSNLPAGTCVFNVSAVLTDIFSVTYNLDHAVSSNTDTVIYKGTEYYTVISPEPGYELTLVKWTMNGTTHVSQDGIIHILDITGDLVITATTRKMGFDLYYLGGFYTHTNTATRFDAGQTYSDTISGNASYPYLEVVDVSVNGVQKYYNAGVQTCSYSIELPENESGDIYVYAIGRNINQVARFTYNLEHVTADSSIEWVPANTPYTVTFTPDPGYEIRTAEVQYDYQLTRDQLTDNGDGTYSFVRDAVVSGTHYQFYVSAESTEPFKISYNLTNCQSSNTDTSVARYGSYTTTITADSSWYDIVYPIVYTMGSEEFQIWTNVINISRVTGDITITATAKLHDFNVTRDNAFCNHTNTATSVTAHESFVDVITPMANYPYLVEVDVSMGGTLLDSSTTIKSGSYTVNIPDVTGDIYIKSIARNINQIARFTYDLTNVTSNNNTAWASAGDSYSVTFSPIANYKITKALVYYSYLPNPDPLTDNGDGTFSFTRSSVVSGYEYRFFVEAVPIVTHYSVTYNLTGCYSTNTDSSVSVGSLYYTQIIPDSSDYEISSLSVTMDGESVQPYDFDKVRISSVTGDLVITAVATKIKYDVTWTKTFVDFSNDSSTAEIHSSYYNRITPVYGYPYLTEVVVKMGNAIIDSSSSIDASYYDVSIGDVTGNIDIYAIARNSSQIAFFTYNLSNVTTSNDTSWQAADTSYYARFSPISDYEITRAQVYYSYIPQPDELTDLGDGTYSFDRQAVVGGYNYQFYVEAVSSITEYTITYNLTNCQSSNTSTSVGVNDPYSTTISTNVTDYEMKSIVCTMGGNTVSVTNNQINISKVTGNIVITAVAGIIQYDVDTDVYRVNMTNDASLADIHSTYTNTLTPFNNYYLTQVDVSMNGSVIDSSSSIQSGSYTVNIADVTGPIRVYAIAWTSSNVSIFNYTNLVHVTSSNTVPWLAADSSYYSIFSPESGYEITRAQVQYDNTQPLYDLTDMGDGRYSYTDNDTTAGCEYKFFVEAVEIVTEYSVTYNLTNCQSSNTATDVSVGASYTTTISTNVTDYEVKSVTCTMGGESVTVTNNTINIARVTGDIVITATAGIITYPVTLNKYYVNMSNDSSYVEIHSSYTNTVTATSSYPNLTQVDVSMNGTLIDTSTGIESGSYTVNIASVTGPIEITGRAGNSSQVSNFVYNVGDHITVSTDKTWQPAYQPFTVTFTPDSNYQITTHVWHYSPTYGDYQLTDNGDGTYTFSTQSTGYGLTYVFEVIATYYPDYYSVTYNLNNAVSSTTYTQAGAGSSYSTTVTPASGYNTVSVECTMGGVQQSVSDGVINIGYVSGNIVINATGGGTNYTVTRNSNSTYVNFSNTSNSVAQGSTYSNTVSITENENQPYLTNVQLYHGSTLIDSSLSCYAGSYTMSVADVSDNITVQGYARNAAAVTRYDTSYVNDYITTSMDIPEWEMAGQNRNIVFSPSSSLVTITNHYYTVSNVRYELDDNGDGTYSFVQTPTTQAEYVFHVEGTRNYVNVEYDLDEHVSSSNDASIVQLGSSYSTQLTCDSSYYFETISCTMGNETISVINGAISIANVTDDITINCKTVLYDPTDRDWCSELDTYTDNETANRFYLNNTTCAIGTVTQNLLSDNTYGIASLWGRKAGSTVTSPFVTEIKLTYADGYQTDNVLTDPVEVTAYGSSSNYTTIFELTTGLGTVLYPGYWLDSSHGQLKRADLTVDNARYTITNNLTNCTNSNTDSSILANQSYSGTISVTDELYEISSISYTMGGTTYTVTGNTISIASVTGDIVITAVATQAYYSVTNSLLNCTNSNSATKVAIGGTYTATLTPGSGYYFNELTVLNGSATVSCLNGNISISSVTGNISITAVCRNTSWETWVNGTVTNTVKHTGYTDVANFKSDYGSSASVYASVPLNTTGTTYSFSTDPVSTSGISIYGYVSKAGGTATLTPTVNISVTYADGYYLSLSSVTMSVSSSQYSSLIKTISRYLTNHGFAKQITMTLS